MTKAQLIAKFNLYTDDSTELSDSETSDLFDKVYRDICVFKPWEFTKSAHTATVSGTTTSLPSDFLSLTKNANYTDNRNYASDPVVFVGSVYTAFKVVNWSDRRQYNGATGYAYLDIPNSNLVFTASISDTVEFDYQRQMPALASSESPAFPEEFHMIIPHAMAVDEMMIELFEKARSYADENEAKYNYYLGQMSVWNARLLNL